jgi:hypothetical protein
VNMAPTLQRSLLHLQKIIHGSRSLVQTSVPRVLCSTGLELQANFNNATLARVIAEESMEDVETHFDVREARFDAAKFAWNTAFDELNAHQRQCADCRWE